MSAVPAQHTDSNKERTGVDDGWAATSAAIEGRQEVRKLCSRAFPALQEKASWVVLLPSVSAHSGQLESAEKGARYTFFKTKSYSRLHENARRCR